MWNSLSAGLLKRQLLGEIARLARLPEAELLAGWDQAREAVAQGVEAVSEGRPQPTWKRQRKGGAPTLPAARPLTPEDQLLRLLLVHAAWWEQLSHATHERLLARETPHAQLLAWLDRQIADQGALHWAALRPLLAADESALESLRNTGRLDLEALDLQATLESPFSDLEALLERLERPNPSPDLGRSAIGHRS
jgi:DNA primase